MADFQAFPLDWPKLEPRTKMRQKARFEDRTFAQARDGLIRELELLGARQIVISSNVPLRQDGLPAGNRNRLPDPGVAVYFLLEGQPRCLPCDRWERIEDNLRAVALSIEAMRGLDRWGCPRIVSRAFSGLTALPAPEQWWDVLEVKADSPLEVCESNYKARIYSAHPDRGGSEGKAARLTWAIGEARRERGKAA